MFWGESVYDGGEINKNTNKISLTVPSAADFVRKCYRVSQTDIYKSPDFMSDDSTRETVLFNRLTKSIDNVIRSYVPLHNIISMNISTFDQEQEESESESDTPPEDDDVLMPDAAEKKIDIV
jgi:hypothetical protein